MTRGTAMTANRRLALGLFLMTLAEGACGPTSSRDVEPTLEDYLDGGDEERGGTGGGGRGGGGGSNSGGVGGSGPPAGGSGGTITDAAAPDRSSPPADTGSAMPDAPSVSDDVPPANPMPDAAPSPDTAPAPSPDSAPMGFPMTGLVGHWTFDETSGTRAQDRSGRGNHGALMEYAQPSWRTGKVNGALGFDGSSNWVKVPSSTSLNTVGNALTLAAWANPSATKTGWAMVASRQVGTTGAEHYGLGFFNGRASVLVASNQAGTHQCSAGAVASNGAWIHMALVHDGTTMRLFVDGAEACMVARAVTLPDDTRPLVIGGNANTSADDAQELFAGALDDVALWSRALSAAELGALLSR